VSSVVGDDLSRRRSGSSPPPRPRGACVADVARRHDITRQRIYQWRRELRGKGVLSDTPSMLLPVELVADEAHPERNGADPGGERDHRVEIRLRNGRSVLDAVDIPDLVLHRMIRIAEAS
jgi:transposase